MSEEMACWQCFRCLREADPPVFIFDGTCYCVVCASEVIAVAVQRYGLAIKKRLGAG